MNTLDAVLPGIIASPGEDQGPRARRPADPHPARRPPPEGWPSETSIKHYAALARRTGGACAEGSINTMQLRKAIAHRRRPVGVEGDETKGLDALLAHYYEIYICLNLLLFLELIIRQQVVCPTSAVKLRLLLSSAGEIKWILKTSFRDV